MQCTRLNTPYCARTACPLHGICPREAVVTKADYAEAVAKIVSKEAK